MYLGRIDNVMEHAHHALQIIFNRSGKFQFRTDGPSIECGGVIIGGDQRHQLVSSDDSQVHVWLDKEATDAKKISAQHLREKEAIKIIDDSLLERLIACVNTGNNCLDSREQARDVYRKIVFELAGSSSDSGDPIDPRIVTALKLLREKYLSQKLGIAEIAGNVGLSQSRLIHLFTEQIGIPIRRYVLWIRLLTAMQMSSEGKQSLTEAAHNAGFSDAAHFSRTYRSMFGITPKGCTEKRKFVRVFSCFS